LTSIDDVVGKVTRYPVAADEQVTPSKIVSVDSDENVDSLSFAVPEGMRAISISADQVLSAGGLVLPGDYVDIIAVFNVKNAQGDEEKPTSCAPSSRTSRWPVVAQKIADSPAADDERQEIDSKVDPRRPL
jgi:Flp pilus assembly protein CpaB